MTDDPPFISDAEREVLDACRAYYEDVDADSDDVLLPVIARWLEAESG